METCKIFIVDDHKAFREGLSFVLSQSENIEIIGEAVNGQDFVDRIDDYEPDIVFMDIAMPKLDGIEATRKALEIQPDLKIIALSMFGDEEYYYKMIHAGVKGFVLKEAGSNELDLAIQKVLKGDNYFSIDLLRNVVVSLNEKKTTSLLGSMKFSDKESDVLNLICSGMSDEEIANRLNLSTKTITGHKNKLLQKTNSNNSIDLVMYAIKNQLIVFNE